MEKRKIKYRHVHKNIKPIIFVYTGEKKMVVVDGYVGPFAEKEKAQTVKAFKEAYPDHHILPVEISADEFKAIIDPNYNVIDIS